jgi:hypothetical protein
VVGSDAQALAAAARRYTALRRKQADASGELSTCDIKPDPGAYCGWVAVPGSAAVAAVPAQGQCTLNAPGGAAR